MIKVDARARLSADRAGEPLDGLVNMFDIGIVLAVGFLIAALQALNLNLVKVHTALSPSKHLLIIHPHEKVEKVEPGTKEVHVKSATSVGKVYELPNGTLVLVKEASKK